MLEVDTLFTHIDILIIDIRKTLLSKFKFIKHTNVLKKESMTMTGVIGPCCSVFRL